MALPKIAVPEYELVLPISKKKIKHRIFLSQEEKILLMALENFGEDEDSETKANNAKDLINAIIKISQNCILTENVTVEDLPKADLESLFLNLRKKSIGEIVEIGINHKCEDGKIHLNKIDVDLNTTNLVIPENFSNKIEISPTSGFTLKHPTLKAALEVNGSKKQTAESFYEFIARSIDQIYDGDDFFDASTVDEKELLEWTGRFPREVSKKVFDFFENSPHLLTKISYTCKGCGKEEILEIKGTSDFFT